MDKIKLRAWQKHHKRMVDVLRIDFVERTITVRYNNNYMNPIQTFAMDYFDLMEYTKLKDKHNVGHEIYHKDIVEITDGYSGDYLEKGGNFIVDWVEDGWGITDKNGEYFCSLWEAIYCHSAKIVGNTYENPELVGMGKI